MPRVVRFDCYEVDLDGGQLLKRGARVRLPDQAFRVLAALLEHPREMVARQELRRRLWPGEAFGDFDNLLNAIVARVREALGDSPDRPRFIETLPKRGYRFIEPVSGPHPGTEATARRKPRLLVLPFLNASGDPDEEYFSDAMTEEIIAALAALAAEGLAVIARTTSMRYKATRKDVARIARELALDWVVEGSARRAVDHVSLTVQLIRVSDQSHVFAKRYDADLADVFGLQQLVAEAVAKNVGVGPAGAPGAAAADQSRPPRKPTVDLVAYASYLRGRQHLDRPSPASLAKAREYLEAAVARDANFALAFDALAELTWLAGFFGVVPPRQALSTGIVHALRAVGIDGSVAEAHSQLAQFLKQLDFNWKEVEREMALALALDPRSPTVLYRHALSGLMPHGRLDEAVEELERALEVDPLGFFPRAWLAVMHWLRRDFDASIEQARVLSEIEAAAFLGCGIMGLALCSARRFDESLEAIRRAVELSGGAPMTLGWLGLALAQSGDAPAARALYDRLRAMPPGVYVPPTNMAWIHLGLGEVDGFFEWMERAIDERDHMIMPIKTYPFLDLIRDDRRYAGLLRKMNLA